MKTLNVSEVVFRDDLYPRIETSATTVQKYAEDLSVLPPIEVNQHNELIDGWHRWTAHKKAKATEISVTVTKTASDSELLEFAIERNAIHGLQLSQKDKQKMAVRIYNSIVERPERMAVKARLVKILGVSLKLLDSWLARSEKDLKEAAKREAFALWLSCSTQDEIAERIGWPRRSIADWLKGIGGNPEIGEFANTDESDETESPLRLTAEELANASHSTGFQIPLYNVWKQQTKSEGASHFGNTESRWLDNLLYLYTSMFDIVIDPFAGGGSTIEVCKKRLRRYWVSDRLPVVEREKEIRRHDLIDGVPDLRKRWSDVRLVYLDPPYWKQAEGQYSTDANDLANMDLETFNKTLSGIVSSFSKKMTSGVIAVVIQPTQWKAPDRVCVDHVADLLKAVKLPLEMRYSVPYESQQCNAQMVEWAKERKRCLVLTREIIVWRVA